MCQFKSAIVTRNLDVLQNPFTDSHEDLVRLFKLNDTPTVRGEPRFARVEFYPDDPKDYADSSKFKLRIDEAREPEWFDDKAKKKVTEKLRIVIDGMIIRGEADILCGGEYILATDAKVSTVKNAIIKVMLGSSKVGTMLGSSKVGTMRESSKVDTMWGSSKVGTMLGSSNVGEMRESSKVGTMLGSSKVGTMRESSNVGTMWESSKVGTMLGSSNVGEMKDASSVSKTGANAKNPRTK